MRRMNTMSGENELDPLLERAAAGDSAARQELLVLHEERLKRMVRVRMDQRLSARVDASDVLQDVYIDAWRKLPRYLAERPVPFYPWLRRIAWENIVDLHRAHIGAQRRSVERERREPLALLERSTAQLVDLLCASGTTASKRLVREEDRKRLFRALEDLQPGDREILVLRFLEELPVKEVAEIVGASEGAVKVRCFRAVARLHALLQSMDPEISGS